MWIEHRVTQTWSLKPANSKMHSTLTNNALFGYNIFIVYARHFNQYKHSFVVLLSDVWLMRFAVIFAVDSAAHIERFFLRFMLQLLIVLFSQQSRRRALSIQLCKEAREKYATSTPPERPRPTIDARYFASFDSMWLVFWYLLTNQLSSHSFFV